MVNLVHEADVHADLSADDVGVGSFGHRMVVNVTGGKVTGDRLTGEIVGAGGDWILLGADGYARLDVRFTLETEDGAHAYVQYLGLLELTPAVQDILGGGSTPTDYGDQYFFTSPRVETGDERYSWLNRTMFVSQGRVLAGPAVEYRMCRVTN
jgi:hypothetical protein